LVCSFPTVHTDPIWVAADAQDEGLEVGARGGQLAVHRLGSGLNGGWPIPGIRSRRDASGPNPELEDDERHGHLRSTQRGD
jgi:hypothetical protein